MWLLLQSVLLQYQSLYKAGLMPTAEQEATYQARFFDDDADALTPRLLTIAGNSAEIAIQGVLTNRPSFMSSVFGGGNSTYPDIIAALAIAEQDENVEDITLAIDSPGGQIDGMFETLAAIDAVTKPVKAVVSNVAASAAYAIAAKADTIEAANRAARFGSIGIVVQMTSFDSEFKIASTQAPKKAPDPATLEGQAMVREELDPIHDLFVEEVAAGRNTSSENVNSTFGQGGTFLAEEALKRGMIDSVAATALKSVPTKTNSNTSAAASSEIPKVEADEMDINKLKAEHPAVYALAVADGEALERDRVSAHLIAGESSGDMKTATTAIKEGTAMTATMQSTYMSAAMNKTDINDRNLDDGDAAALAAQALEDAKKDLDTDGASATVADMVEANMGLDTANAS